MATAPRDRFGLLWRREIAAELRPYLDRIEVLQIIADDWIGAPGPWCAALRALARRVPVHLHGIGLGLASAAPVDDVRLERLARFVGAVAPERWSEHLAFVRGGGVEIGHLAAPPRSVATLEGLVRNVARARRIVGALPELENVASPIDPPGSQLGEPEWLATTLSACEAPLLLDLHNLHANAINFGFDPIACLEALPLERVATVHVAGGRRVRARSGAERILDDHAHPVPREVHALLHALGARTRHGIDVILEREAELPPVGVLLDEVAALRATLARGRREARAAS